MCARATTTYVIGICVKNVYCFLQNTDGYGESYDDVIGNAPPVQAEPEEKW